MLLSVTVNKPHAKHRQHRTLNLQCDACSKQFTHRYNKTHAERTKHFCSTTCVSEGKKVNPGMPRYRDGTCERCGQPFTHKRRNTNASAPRFCSHSCAASAISTRLNLAAHMNTPEARARSIETHRQTCAKWKSGELPNPLIGRSRPPVSDETRAKLRAKNGGVHNAFYGKKHTVETRERMREARTKLIIAGKMRWALFGHKAGEHTSSKLGRNVHFRSSWEEATMQWLDANPDVITWDYECVRISYTYDNHKRWYVPDFLITFADGHREMWEVKAREFVAAEKNVLKTAAAQAYCAANDIFRYVIMTGVELRQEGIVK